MKPPTAVLGEALTFGQDAGSEQCLTTYCSSPSFSLLLFSIRPDVIPDLLMYLTFTQNLAWQHPVFFQKTWSLAVEEVFYLITPLVVGVFLLVLKKPRLAMFSSALTILAFSVSCRGYVVLTANPTLDDGVRKIALLRLDALMVGVLVAWAYAYLWHWRSVFQRMALFLSPCL
jgi:peptidoglycan/LPS O-acetylase OafA/YrhL